MMLTEAIHHQTEKMVATFGNEQKQLVLLMQTLILLKILKFALPAPKVIRAIMAIKGIPAQAFPNLKRTIH